MKRSAPKKHYFKLVEWSEEDGVYVGRCPELFFGGVHGSDEKKVYAELCEVVEEVLAMKEEHHDPLPEPLSEKEFSGRFVLRLDPDTHKSLALRALVEGQSLNAYCVERLAGAAIAEQAAVKRLAARRSMTKEATPTKRRRTHATA